MTWARRRFVDDFLGFLERREARQLSWGFYDITFDVESAETALLSEGSEGLIAMWQGLVADGESMVALELAGAFLEKFGGDSLEETRRNFDGYQKQLDKF